MRKLGTLDASSTRAFPGKVSPLPRKLSADNLNIYAAVGNDEQNALQHAITRVAKWCASNNMEFSAVKCAVLFAGDARKEAPK